ncbi:MAG: 16S rRNA (cytosine(1402)-N(4))-methyltransferase [candidate division Zixibacteria bacterium RBG_16_50_21]|nr:MAG: 16S rRNA (cytosine(1402)-N(4))-methyltransferase [candidate division Zixibacteria bacterium RBG_16_50_21]
MSGLFHRPVLLDEVVKYLVTDKQGTYLDCTVGLGGHAEGILRILVPPGKLVGIDRDEQALQAARDRLKEFQNLTLLKLNFGHMEELTKLWGAGKFSGILLDLGLGSWQINLPERGFSYLEEGPLDMRMDKNQGLSARDVVNSYSQIELVRIFSEFGEEKLSKRIAKKIAEAQGKIDTTSQLTALVSKVVPTRYRIKTLSRIFQAIRIEVNKESEELAQALKIAPGLVKFGGRIGIISYHSLEDRLVKQSFQRLSKKCLCPPGSPVCTCGGRARWKLVTKKPVIPSRQETEQNSRARSAKFRVIERMAA